MHCKSLWIKASAKCINVNVLIYSVITLMSFQTCKRFFLWWKLKGEFLKNVHAGLLRTIHSDHVCQTSNMTNYKNSIKLAHMHYSTVSKKLNKNKFILLFSKDELIKIDSDSVDIKHRVIYQRILQNIIIIHCFHKIFRSNQIYNKKKCFLRSKSAY